MLSNILADAVKVALGPKRPVVIDKSLAHRASQRQCNGCQDRSGDKFRKHGPQMVKVGRTNDEAGDGTTTTVLAKLDRSGRLWAGMNLMDLKRDQQSR
jgi:chaperonin GroEL (HSP60 family)